MDTKLFDMPVFPTEPTHGPEVIRLASQAELDAKAAEGRWCRAGELTQRFYKYLDTGALNRKEYDFVLCNLFMADGMVRAGRYGFAECAGWMGVIGPGSLPLRMQQALAMAVNARRGIVTELPAGFEQCAQRLALLLPWRLTVAVVDKPPQGDNRPFAPEDDPARLRAALETGCAGRRRGFAARAHLTPLDTADAAQLYTGNEYIRRSRALQRGNHHGTALLQTAGSAKGCRWGVNPVQPFGMYKHWQITNRLHCPPSARTLGGVHSPALVVLAESADGTTALTTATAANRPGYWALLKDCFTVCSPAAVRLWVLVLGTDGPLCAPEPALRCPCVGFAIDRAARTLTLTEGADALTMLHDALTQKGGTDHAAT